MVHWTNRYGPIGIELSSRSVRLVQFTADQKRLIDAARWEVAGVSGETLADERGKLFAAAIRQARHGRSFKGSLAAVCIAAPDLFVQNIRVPKGPTADLPKVIGQEAAARLPFPASEAEIRYLSVSDVRQGEQIKRELILLACKEKLVTDILSSIHAAGLRALAIDVEPAAILRSYVQQLRRGIDKDQPAMYVRLGYDNTAVIITQGTQACFIKYIDVGGVHLDQAVSDHLNVPPEKAASLRRYNGERRVEQQDPEIVRSIKEATRPIIERLVNELALCIRYYRVAFRGQSLNRLILGGVEAVQGLVDQLGPALDIKCEMGDPLRGYESPLGAERRGQWDVAAGLALRTVD